LTEDAKKLQNMSIDELVQFLEAPKNSSGGKKQMKGVGKPNGKKQ